jgi:hypothetical protein
LGNRHETAQGALEAEAVHAGRSITESKPMGCAKTAATGGVRKSWLMQMVAYAKMLPATATIPLSHLAHQLHLQS